MSYQNRIVLNEKTKPEEIQYFCLHPNHLSPHGVFLAYPRHKVHWFRKWKQWCSCTNTRQKYQVSSDCAWAYCFLIRSVPQETPTFLLPISTKSFDNGSMNTTQDECIHIKTLPFTIDVREHFLICKSRGRYIHLFSLLTNSEPDYMGPVRNYIPLASPILVSLA